MERRMTKDNTPAFKGLRSAAFLTENQVAVDSENPQNQVTGYHAYKGCMNMEILGFALLLLSSGFSFSFIGSRSQGKLVGLTS